MLQTIVVPLDGSELAERAVPYGRALVQTAGGRVLLVRGVGSDSWTPSSRDQQRAERLQARNELAQVAREVRARGVAVEWQVLDREAAWAILDVAERERADLIVMSTHGRSGLGRWVFGSVAERVLQLAPCPVLLIPATARVDPDDTSPFRLVLALDGSVLSEDAIEPAAALAAAMGGEVLLVRSVDPFGAILLGTPAAAAHYDPVAEIESARDYLERCARRFTGHTQVRTHVAEGRPDEVILAAARAFDAHVIAMATHGRSGLSLALLGSIATAVLHAAHLPILLVRPAAASHRVDEPAPPAARQPAP